MTGKTHKARGGWYEVRDGAQFTLARHLPVRFDVVAEADFPLMRRGRLARQIRQDLWRELRGLRGFSPVVQVDTSETGLRVRAGGQMMVAGPLRRDLAERIKVLLSDPARRARWQAWAQERGA